MQYGVPFQIETKSLDGDEWAVEGYASTYDLDLGGDAVVPGAYKSTLDAVAGGKAKVRFLFNHDLGQVLGTAQALHEDGKGLYGRFKISKTPLGESVRTLLRDGALDSFSIGYIARDYDRDEKTGTRRLKDIELIECSVVATPMNPMAVVTGVKSFDRMAMEDIGATLRRQRSDALEAARAYLERRKAEGREPKDHVLEALEQWKRDAAREADDLLALLTGATDGADAPGESPAAEAKAAETTQEPVAAKAAGGLVDTYLRRQRELRLARKYAVTAPPAPDDPVWHLERLEYPGTEAAPR